MVFNPPTNFSLFKQRRQRLLENAQARFGHKKGVILISAGFETERHAFRQDSSFYYLTGITEPAGMLALYLDGREVLYIPRFKTDRSQWLNVTVSGPEDARKLEFDEIKFLGCDVPGYSFSPIFTQDKYETLLTDIDIFLDPVAKVYTLLDRLNTGYFMQISLYEKLQNWLPALQHCTIDISSLVHELRRNKDEYEINQVYKAVQITNTAQKAALEFLHAGKYEYEVQAAIECVYTSLAAATCSFPSIVATGKNTTVLHYTDRNAQLKDGDLVVIDIGAEYGYYAADITRTWPVSGVFTPRQREIYQLVLDAQLYIESIAQPGMFLVNAKVPEKSLHHLAVKFFEERGYAQYFCHRLGHYLGLDVHDVGDYTTPLMPGDIFTIEPGLYLPAENIGVRIEDDYVMADDGAVCLSFELPKNPDEIEELMHQAKQ
jgi:Xaa-Pro aminopeptidase